MLRSLYIGNLRYFGQLWRLHYRFESACPSADTVPHRWLSGIMLKVIGSAMLGVGMLLPVAECAAAVEDDKKKAAAKLKQEDLSLYITPSPSLESGSPEGSGAGQVEETVATIRKSVGPFVERCQDTYGKVKPQVDRVLQFGSDTCSFFKHPPMDLYPRVGVIGLSGVLGFFLARGSRMKRLLYPVALVSASASLYYPGRATEIAKLTGDVVYDRAVRSYVALESLMKGSKKAEGGDDPATKPRAP